MTRINPDVNQFGMRSRPRTSEWTNRCAHCGHQELVHRHDFGDHSDIPYGVESMRMMLSGYAGVPISLKECVSGKGFVLYTTPAMAA